MVEEQASRSTTSRTELPSSKAQEVAEALAEQAETALLAVDSLVKEATAVLEVRRTAGTEELAEAEQERPAVTAL
jgi:flagellar biosynthesis/type III secretory pathway ATPase